MKKYRTPTPPPKRVREPIQVYLDEHDRALLDAAAKRADLPRSEVLRIALRRLAAELPGAARPGASLATLIGALDSAKDVPRDLAEHHDDYLYPWPAAKARKVAEGK